MTVAAGSRLGGDETLRALALDIEGRRIANTDSRVTIHLAASLDGFSARKDGSVDWLETSDEFENGDTMDPELVEELLRTIDCYVMGSRTYETALDFEAKGVGWAYGDKPTFVLTTRKLPVETPRPAGGLARCPLRRRTRSRAIRLVGRSRGAWPGASVSDARAPSPPDPPKPTRMG